MATSAEKASTSRINEISRNLTQRSDDGRADETSLFDKLRFKHLSLSKIVVSIRRILTLDQNQKAGFQKVLITAEVICDHIWV